MNHLGHKNVFYYMYARQVSGPKQTSTVLTLNPIFNTDGVEEESAI